MRPLRSALRSAETPKALEPTALSLIERYILRIAFTAFVACLLGLTAVIWITQALRELDLITSKGQTMLVFLSVTGLSLPTLVAVISPVALFIAAIYCLNKLNGDSELIVMSAAGMPPRLLMKPFLVLAAVVCALVSFLSLYVMPASFQELRDLITRIRADFVANIVKQGQFTSLENGVTFHFRERTPNGALLGIFMQDRREEGRSRVYLAERGQTADANEKSYLVLEKGSVHRQEPNQRDQSIIAFERYAVDLAALSPPIPGEMIYKPRERTTAQLLAPTQEDWVSRNQPGKLRAELHDRLSVWLYPLAVILIAFAALGDPRTTRQGRGAAIAAAVIAVGGLRIIGFAASSAVARTPAAIVFVYGAPLAAIAIALALAFQGPRLRAAAASLLSFADPAPLFARLPRIRRA